MSKKILCASVLLSLSSHIVAPPYTQYHGGDYRATVPTYTATSNIDIGYWAGRGWGGREWHGR